MKSKFITVVKNASAIFFDVVWFCGINSHYFLSRNLWNITEASCFPILTHLEVKHGLFRLRRSSWICLSRLFVLPSTSQLFVTRISFHSPCSVVDGVSQCLNHSDTKSTLMYSWNKTSNAFKEETAHFRGRPRCIYPLLPSIPASHNKNSLVDTAC